MFREKSAKFCWYFLIMVIQNVASTKWVFHSVLQAMLNIKMLMANEKSYLLTAEQVGNLLVEASEDHF